MHIPHIPRIPQFRRVLSQALVCLSLALSPLLGCAEDTGIGAAGESCQSRADCAEGLACFSGTCAASEADVAKAKDLGTAGESCTRRADCVTGLQCIAQVCVEAPPEGGTGTGGMAGVGQPCVDTVDCVAGLNCVDLICVEPAGEDEETGGGHSGGAGGGQGESCQTTVDCMSPLACIRGTCGVRDFDVEATNNECVLIECEQPEDCCPEPAAHCSTLEEQCEQEKDNNDGMEGFVCAEWRRLCVCDEAAWACHDDRCIAQATCVDDAECLNGVCDSGVCVQCKDDSDCAVLGGSCVDNLCQKGCEHDGQCPALHECDSGQCVEVGCRDDRECIACTGSVQAYCDDSVCRRPCASDAECASPDDFNYQACVDGFCQDVGCKTDEECKIRTQGSNPTGRFEARCRERETAGLSICR